ncbi:MAG: hypothetical protein ABI960_01805 [Candidatus Eisenbacteria bacterium]
MNACSRHSGLVVGAVCALLLAAASVGSATTIVLRSGAVAPTAPDPTITFLVEPSGQCATPFAAAFSAADFAAADAGPPAWSLPAYGAWGANLWCDPVANWISTAPGWPSRSALYAVPFDVPLPDPCCIEHATLDFCWMADDILGDPASYGGPNPLGVYLNGAGLPIAGGNYGSATRVIVDITSLLRCGQNHLYVYNRDLGCAVAGTNFSATINYVECTTPAKSSSWGAVRALYR